MSPGSAFACIGTHWTQVVSDGPELLLDGMHWLVVAASAKEIGVWYRDFRMQRVWAHAPIVAVIAVRLLVANVQSDVLQQNHQLSSPLTSFSRRKWQQRHRELCLVQRA